MYLSELIGKRVISIKTATVVGIIIGAYVDKYNFESNFLILDSQKTLNLDDLYEVGEVVTVYEEKENLLDLENYLKITTMQEVVTVSGERLGKVKDLTLNDNIWNIEINDDALLKAVKLQLAATRQGTHKTKTRSEVSGGGRKPWKQKGTGRARQGSIRAVQWVGGGVAFAPKPRSYNYTLPKKVRRLAMKSALTSKVQNGEMIVLDALNMEAPKTKEFVQILKNINACKKALVVTAENNENVIKSAKNIEGVATATVNTINVYDILKYDSFIITTDAVKKVEEVYA